MRYVLLLFMFLTISVLSFADIYKYKDEKGRVYFVDSIYKVPLSYRKNVEVLPSGRDVQLQEKPFINILLKKENNLMVGRLYLNAVMSRVKPWLIAIILFFVIILFMILYLKDVLWGFCFVLLFLLILEFSYFFAIYPKIKRTTRVYSYLTEHYFFKCLKVEDRVKKISLENGIIYNPVPLNPYRYYRKMLLLSNFYNRKFNEGCIERRQE